MPTTKKSLLKFTFKQMMNYHSIIAIALFAFTFPLAARANDASCSIDCAPNGSCVGGECVCNKGFAGADCSFPFQICPDDVMTCFDGAECIRLDLSNRLEDGSRSQYECDCSTISDASPFQIAECESPESQACADGDKTSTYAFCTNGGECIDMVKLGQPHAGCRCPNDFEGRHCQYRKGTAPDLELKQAYQEKEHNIEGFVIFLIVLIAGGVLACLGYMVYVLKLKDTTEKPLDDTLDDVELEETEGTPEGEMA